MGAVEIVLLLCGAAIFVISFFLPERGGGDANLFDPDELKRAVDSEVSAAKNKITEVADETVRYAVEKAENSLDRVTNEKIMAVDEYSQEVLSKIDKNHQEVLFLFDMLNEKSVDLKNTVREAQQVEKDTKEAMKESLTIINTPQSEPVPEEAPEPLVQEPSEDFKPLSPMEVLVRNSVQEDSGQSGSRKKQKETGKPSRRKAGANIDMALNEAKTPGKNKNEMILQLHRMGKSNVEVARELGLGMGEVKLVIDLFS